MSDPSMVRKEATMTEQEARVLIDHIKAQCGRDIRGMVVRRIGNGEHVVRCTRPDAVHFWSPEDFRRWQERRVRIACQPNAPGAILRQHGVPVDAACMGV